MPLADLHSEPPDAIDVHVGGRLRLRRLQMNISRKDLGATLGLSGQQIQKYESGANRIGASRLWRIAGALDAPVSYFFAGLAGAGNGATAAAPQPEGAEAEDNAFIAYYLNLPPAVRARTRQLLVAIYDAYGEQ